MTVEVAAWSTSIGGRIMYAKVQFKAARWSLPAGEYSLSFRLRLGRPFRRLGRRIYVFD